MAKINRWFFLRNCMLRIGIRFNFDRVKRDVSFFRNESLKHRPISSSLLFFFIFTNICIFLQTDRPRADISYYSSRRGWPSKKINTKHHFFLFVDIFGKLIYLHIHQMVQIIFRTCSFDLFNSLSRSICHTIST